VAEAGEFAVVPGSRVAPTSYAASLGRTGLISVWDGGASTRRDDPVWTPWSTHFDILIVPLPSKRPSPTTGGDSVPAVRESTSSDDAQHRTEEPLGGVHGGIGPPCRAVGGSSRSLELGTSGPGVPAAFPASGAPPCLLVRARRRQWGCRRGQSDGEKAMARSVTDTQVTGRVEEPLQQRPTAPADHIADPGPLGLAGLIPTGRSN
jgi:hypothetical protein